MSYQSTTAPATFISDEAEFATRTDVYQLRPMRQDEIGSLATTVASVYRSKLHKDAEWKSQYKATSLQSLDNYFHLTPHGLTIYVCEYRDTQGSSRPVGFISYQTPIGRSPSNDPSFNSLSTHNIATEVLELSFCPRWYLTVS